MEKFKLFLVFILLIVQINIWAQQVSLIEASNEGLASLTNEQFSKFEKITNQRLHGTDYLVTIGDLATLQVDGEIEFELPEKDCVIKAKSYRVRYFDNDNYSWSAYVVPNEDAECECKEGSITILKREGKYIGHFSVDDDDFVLQDLGEGKQLLVKLDFTKEELLYCDMNGKEIKGNPNDLHITPRTDENCPVTILALYTANAESGDSDIESTIELAVEETNTAFQRSRVEFELQLVGIEEVDFTESSSIQSDVDDLATDDDIVGLRNDSNADIVVLFTTGPYGNYLGRAAAIGPDDENAFAIVQAGLSLGTLLFPHEVAHLFGCRHQKEVDDTGSFEHAYKLKLGCLKRRKTIMWSKASKKKIQNFSNPQVSYYGKATGVYGERNNALQLNTTNCEVASFRLDDNVESLTGYLSGPLIVCLGEENLHVSAIVYGGAIGAYQYNWSYSYDGFNYTSLGSIFNNVWIPGVTPIPPTLDSYGFFVRVVVTDQDGNSITLFHSGLATNEDLGQDPSCNNQPIPLIGQNNSSTLITVYPNPVGDKLSVNIVNDEDIRNIQVYNLHGRIVLTSINSLDLDVSTLQSGIYFIKRQVGDKIQTSKFIKL